MMIDAWDSNDTHLQFIRDIYNDPNSKPFRYPVDENRDHAKNYYQIISDPMDLDTLQGLVRKYEISDEELIQKLNLIWENAMKYNANENHTVHKKAKQMKILTCKLITKYFPKIHTLRNIIPTRKSNRIKKKEQTISNEEKDNEQEILEKDAHSDVNSRAMMLHDESVKMVLNKLYPDPPIFTNNTPELHITSDFNNKRSAAPSLPPEVALLPALSPALSPEAESHPGSNDLCMMQGLGELHQAHSTIISCETAKSQERLLQQQSTIINAMTETLKQKQNIILSLESRIENMKENSDLKQLLIKYNNLKYAFVSLQLAFKEVETVINSSSFMRNCE